MQPRILLEINAKLCSRLDCNEEHAIVSCDEDWGKVHSMCINENCLFLSNQRGISRIDLSTRQHSLILDAPNDPCKLTKLDLICSSPIRKVVQFGSCDQLEKQMCLPVKKKAP